MRESSPKPSSASRRVSASKSQNRQLTPYSIRFYPQVLSTQYFARTPDTPIPQTLSHEDFTKNDEKKWCEGIPSKHRSRPAGLHRSRCKIVGYPPAIPKPNR